MPRHEQSARPLRVGEAIRHALARIFEHGLRDPDLAEVTLTVTEVRVSPDLKNATAYIVPLGGAHAETVMAGLKRAEGFLRREVAREVELRYAPALHFLLDTSFEHASAINALLHSPDVARDLSIPKAEKKSRKKPVDGG